MLMRPYVRVFGIRYVYDARYRARCRNKVKRARYSSGFRANKKGIRARLAARDGFVCRGCGVTADDRITVDHIVSVANGGNSDITNLQLLCSDCHAEKSRREFNQIPEAQRVQSPVRQKILEKIHESKKREKVEDRAMGALQANNPRPVR